MSSSVEMVKCLLNGKYELTIPRHRADRPEWYTSEGWEKARLDSMHDHIGPGDVVYYVGAEEGEMPALCQMWGAEVVLFEPNPKVWPNIKAIWEANGLDFPLACFEGFAGNKTKDDAYSHVYVDDWMPNAYEEVIGNHGFKELYLEEEGYSQIEISHLVGYGEDGHVKYPTAISIDVEGSEWRVLQGAESLLRSHLKPKIWLSGHPEFMFHQWGEYLTDLRNWIKGFGYKETLLDYKHEVHLFYEAVEK